MKDWLIGFKKEKIDLLTVGKPAVFLLEQTEIQQWITVIARLLPDLYLFFTRPFVDDFHFIRAIY